MRHLQTPTPQRRPAVLVPKALHTLPNPAQLRCRLAALLLAGATVGLYLVLAVRVAGQMGLPLDDAWIHQTYARNLVRLGQWVYTPGTFSAGSTAPLWTILLGVAYLLPGNPLVWTYALGTLFLLGTAWMGYRLSRLVFDDEKIAWATVFALILEWHLAWSSVSGMEILLYTFLALWLFVGYITNVPEEVYPVYWGLLGGLLTLTRPEGLILLGLIALHLLAIRRKGALWPLSLMGLAWLLVVGPYLAFNWVVSGHIFPNTFYAKQQEYAELIGRLPLWIRVARQGLQPLVGAQVLLVPGIAWLVWQGMRRAGPLWARAGSPWLPLIWASVLILIYAIRLPVTYQHGRYMMPLVPVVLVYGVGSTWRLVERVRSRVVRRAWALSVALLFVIFWIRGAVAYAEDTAIITCEAVETAHWLARHTPPDAVVAAHDIGAIGYFAPRPLVDMAGLVSPEVIPIIRDEQALAEFLKAHNADYLVVAPDWYPTLVQMPGVELVHRQACPLTQRSGYASTAVYRLEWP